MNVGKESLRNLGNLLKEYEDNSSQKINSLKSYFYISFEVKKSKIDIIEDIAGWRKREFPFIYLRGPIFHREQG